MRKVTAAPACRDRYAGAACRGPSKKNAVRSANAYLDKSTESCSDSDDGVPNDACGYLLLTK
jgi:hypothetical protein